MDRMDGQEDGQTDDRAGWADGWMHRRTDRQAEGQPGVCMCLRMYVFPISDS